MVSGPQQVLVTPTNTIDACPTTCVMNSPLTFSSPITTTAPSNSSVREPPNIDGALNPYATQFQPSNKTVPNRRKSHVTSSFTPQQAEVEALRIELSYAQTKISELEATINDQKNSLTIYKEKLKLRISQLP